MGFCFFFSYLFLHTKQAFTGVEAGFRDIRYKRSVQIPRYNKYIHIDM